MVGVPPGFANDLSRGGTPRFSPPPAARSPHPTLPGPVFPVQKGGIPRSRSLFLPGPAEWRLNSPDTPARGHTLKAMQSSAKEMQSCARLSHALLHRRAASAHAAGPHTSRASTPSRAKAHDYNLSAPCYGHCPEIRRRLAHQTSAWVFSEKAPAHPVSKQHLSRSDSHSRARCLSSACPAVMAIFAPGVGAAPIPA